MNEKPEVDEQVYVEDPDRVISRASYIVGILTSIQAIFMGAGVFPSPLADKSHGAEVVLTGSDGKNHIDFFVEELVSKCDRPIRHWIESGGAGGEALMRLMGEEVLESFPEVRRPESTDSTEKIVAITPIVGGYQLDISFIVRAKPPTNEGRETWNDDYAREERFIVKMRLMYRELDCENMINKYEQQKKEMLQEKYGR